MIYSDDYFKLERGDTIFSYFYLKDIERDREILHLMVYFPKCLKVAKSGSGHSQDLELNLGLPHWCQGPKNFSHSLLSPRTQETTVRTLTK